MKNKCKHCKHFKKEECAWCEGFKRKGITIDGLLSGIMWMIIGFGIAYVFGERIMDYIMEFIFRYL